MIIQEEAKEDNGTFDTIGYSTWLNRDDGKSAKRHLAESEFDTSERSGKF